MLLCCFKLKCPTNKTLNELVLNKSKTKTLPFGTRWRLGGVSNFDIYLNGTKLEQVYSIKYLGITLDC